MNTRGDIYNEIRAYLSKIENPTIFELGCHQGEDSHILFNSANGNVNYYAFEPLPQNIVAIKSKLHIPSNVTFNLHELAVGSVSGFCDLHVSEGTHPNGLQNTMASSLRQPKNVKSIYPFIAFEKTISVRTTTIDDFVADNNIVKIDFIWCDIQGCEYDMIVGAKNNLNNIGMMLLEYSEVELYDGEKGCDDIMAALGSDWSIVVKTQEDILVRNNKYER